MAIRVLSRALFSTGERRFDAYVWEVNEDGYLQLLLKGGDLLAEFPPGKWDMVEDLDPHRTEESE